MFSVVPGMFPVLFPVEMLKIERCSRCSRYFGIYTLLIEKINLQKTFFHKENANLPGTAGTMLKNGRSYREHFWEHFKKSGNISYKNAYKH